MARKDVLFGWIEACLHYGGTFGSSEKAVYCQRFGLSEPSASRHQAEFLNIYEAAGAVTFARNAASRIHGGKLTPETTLPAKPLFSRMPSLETWLEDNFGGTSYFNVEIPRREPEPWILRAIIHSIRSKKALQITYHSRSGPSTRIVTPHAIVKIVGRTHMRAYDHSKNHYGDFVLSRVTAAALNEQIAFVGNERDMQWQTIKKVTVSDTTSSDDQTRKRGIQLDYGLDQTGQRSFKFRQPLVQYLIDDMEVGYAAPVQITLDT
ncbi:WYL domain-containing protein [Cypionkella sp.]|uniref:WYL domain-containing protein n=1 Tax=Cypionkella sp. TaxID=2811411 RepID=UPI002719F220|nr:WYL domain-containing protein [Cypionkella sp.]MDO8985957.1 WYL domain-containing protein [Cypionkella sp.]MDP2048145.1 WYL domain-containing protein [Cypionkella sp.]